MQDDAAGAMGEAGGDVDQFPADGGSAGLAVVECGQVPGGAALAARCATDAKLAECVKALAKVDQPEHIAHGYLIGCLLELGEAVRALLTLPPP